MAIGRISGPLLKSNLVRDGVDLAFETDLLYLDVNNRRIGVNTASPSVDLDINGTIRTNNFQIDNQLDVAQFTFVDNNVYTASGIINFQAAAGEATVYHSRLEVDDFRIEGNSISTQVSNSPIEIRPNGTGTLEILSDTNIDGNLTVTGNISADGNITIGGNIVIGDSLTDTIEINASIQSDLIPESDNAYDIGSMAFRWRTIYVNDFYTDTVNLPVLNIGDITIENNEISTGTGNDLYLDGNGSGGVRFGNLLIVDNIITNVSTNAITQIVQTGSGYFKIDTTNGFVPPRGTDAERPTAYAVVGMTRYNTNSKALEIWDGAAWASPAGASGAVSEITANDIAASFALMLG
jgi:hypothetical protein